MHICSPLRRHESSYLYSFCLCVSQYFLHAFLTRLHRFRLTYYLRCIFRPMLWCFGSCSSESGTAGQPGCTRLRQRFLGSRIIGAGSADRTCGRAHRISLRQRFLGLMQRCLSSHISGTVVAGRTRGQSDCTKLSQRLVGNCISGNGGDGQTRGRARRTRLRQIFSLAAFAVPVLLGKRVVPGLGRYFSG